MHTWITYNATIQKRFRFVVIIFSTPIVWSSHQRRHLADIYNELSSTRWIHADLYLHSDVPIAPFITLTVMKFTRIYMLVMREYSFFVPHSLVFLFSPRRDLHNSSPVHSNIKYKNPQINPNAEHQQRIRHSCDWWASHMCWTRLKAPDSVKLIPAINTIVICQLYGKAKRTLAAAAPARPRHAASSR